MGKDVDLLKKRSRQRRDFIEKAGSTGLIFSGLVGMFFLTVLVWQIAIPTFIEGESGEIQPASEFIPSSDYILKWDYPNLKQDGGLKGEPIQLQLSWSDENGSYQETLEILVTDDQGSKTDIYLNQSGLSQNKVEVGKKTKFYVKSTLYSTVKIEQVSGPVPAADESGTPEVSTFVITGDVHFFYADGESVFHVLELAAWGCLLVITYLVIRPNIKSVRIMHSFADKARIIRYAVYTLSILTLIFGTFSFSSILGFACWLLAGKLLIETCQGVERLHHQGREYSEFSRLKHSISNRDGLLMWSSLLLIISTLFIPLLIDIPFLTERYQDIFQPYASGIRSAFFGTVWVMTIAMLVSMPVSIGAAIYLEEYAAPTKTTKFIQALVTNLAGVPSIVFGMFGLAIFVKQGGFGLGMGPSIMAAGLTMGVMAMPIIVLASQEALRSVPNSLRESAYGVGCTQWEVVKDHVIPSAMPGIMTGSILAMSRIMGEAAPLVVVGAAALVLFDPDPLAGVLGGNLNFTVIPIQIYFWTSEPDHAWHSMAAAASITLILLLIAMNSIAIVLRQHYRRRLNP